MPIEIGNKVALIDENLTGVVIAVNKNKITIVSDDEMKYIFDVSELIKIGVDQEEIAKQSEINEGLLQEKNALKKTRVKPFKKNKKEVVMEVDLHIEKLVKSTRNMDKYDILQYQLNTAQHKLEFCIQKHISKLILIHGVGEGVLKAELQFLLNKYPVTYSDASYQKYGMGATEVTI
ncbi:Smr/MutS family protein [Tenacibaculum sp. UWU-22]|uniref:Smr/MutS family protein n=1 Tax=Tenacibaculum sp. UWU-22 TaxID=3234187 RepID=UPI0034DB5C4E